MCRRRLRSPDPKGKGEGTRSTPALCFGRPLKNTPKHLQKCATGQAPRVCGACACTVSAPSPTHIPSESPVNDSTAREWRNPVGKVTRSVAGDNGSQPKGPRQNVLATHVPERASGERKTLRANPSRNSVERRGKRLPVYAFPCEQSGTGVLCAFHPSARVHSAPQVSASGAAPLVERRSWSPCRTVVGNRLASAVLVGLSPFL